MPTILIRPKVLSLKNRFYSNNSKRDKRVRDLILIISASFLLISIFTGTLWLVKQIYSSPTLSSLSTSIPFGLISLMLLFTSVLTALSITLGSFYLSEDLDLILSSPISEYKFFCGRFLQCFFSVVWMPFVFLAPFLLAFAVGKNAPLEFYLFSILLFIPFFIIPVSLSFILSTIIIYYNSKISPRIIRGSLTIIFFSLFLLVIYSLRYSFNNLNSATQVVKLLSVISFPNTLWLPSRWLAESLTGLISGNFSNNYIDLLLLLLTSVSMFLSSYIVFLLFYSKSFSSARNLSNLKKESFLLNMLDKFLTLFFSQKTTSIVIKELRLLFRDLTHLLELTMIIFLSIFYLYNLRSLKILNAIPLDQQYFWKSCLFILNISMVCFVATAISSRFAYPSISREGKSFWILQTSPIKMEEIIRIKFWFWFTPVSLITTCLFFASGYALQISLWRLLITAIITIYLCYGIVKAAIGFGAIFAFFNWEHPSELVGSLGSFIFMLFSCLLIMFSLMPTWLVLFPKTPGYDNKMYLFLALLLIFIFFLIKITCGYVYKRGLKTFLIKEF